MLAQSVQFDLGVAFGSVPQSAKREAVQTREAPKEQKKASREEMEKVAREINENLQAMNTELSFSVDTETNKVVLKIMNSKTHEVIRQIPAEEALRVSSHINRLLGLLIDGNA
jgi:flagellar protein FlaG